MPYIANHRHREIINRVISNFMKLWVRPGYVNYFLFKLAKDTCTSYEQYRNFRGELLMCSDEIYRRFVAPHEDAVKDKNGDVE